MPPSNNERNATELDRLLMALSVRTQIEAAQLLGVRQSMFSDCKRRGRIVTGQLLEQAVRIGVRLEWIREGELPVQREAPTARCEAGRYCLEACPALEAVQHAAALIASCQRICGACEHKTAKTAQQPR